MKRLLLALLLISPASLGQTVIESYERANRERAQFDYEQKLREFQLERMRQGLAPDPSIDAQLRAGDERRRAQECRNEKYYFNGAPMTCRVSAGKATSCWY